ncbi:DNA polymerase III subunit epsilon [Corynebacterium yudongzhengii]|uniref:3'-5' exonuclease n=1 Tax=Corynebacterium yudongzhengii TaxID=2080740 RepID=A0A2U1T9H1_9CORY|nr:3'-5' exonuclease [Corynebacterium yudongzhengii]AWB82081.1 DNA polymerase III subunit epsilon [Corynebacterium yudongzhengii]PWC02585.1 3'-5' exonuclease [Corynebacterium yudongzhengii]
MTGFSGFDASRMLSFDLETTSRFPKEARIVTSALITIDGSHADTTELLADPGVEIPEQAQQVHGITTDYAREHGRPHDEVLEQTITAIEDAWSRGLTLIVFNAPYDLTVLHTLSGGKFQVTGPVFDPFVVDKVKDPYRKASRKLTNICEHYGVTLGNAHEASADAMAAARVAWKQVNKVFPDLKKMDSDELMEFQAVGYYESQTNLHKWLASRGRDTSDVNFSWPMQG